MTKDTCTISVGDYIFKRLSEVTKTVFGVPGDFNLSLLEHIYNFDEETIKWRGNNNELNAGYAADGYSRINNGFSCLITTYGVGELSALNAIAGSFTENVGLLHIVGTSPTVLKTMDKNPMFNSLHHLVPNKKTYGKQDHYVYEKLVEDFCCCVENLTLEDCKFNKIQDKIDNVINQIIFQMKPGYLFVPCDLPDLEFEMDPTKHLNLNLNGNVDLTSDELEIVDYLLEKTYEAENPAFVGDLFMKKDKLQVMNLLEKTNWYSYSTTCARGFVIDESLPNFQGVFANELSTPNTFTIMSSNDFIMHWGSNINEMSFKRRSGCNEEWLSSLNIIFLGKDFVQIGYGENSKKFYTETVNCNQIFQKYLEKLDFAKLKPVQTRSCIGNSVLPKWSDKYDIDISSEKNALLTQEGFSKFLSSDGTLQEGDIIVNELSSFIFEMENIKLPKKGKVINQAFYASIGYALPATLGVCLALKDLGIEDKHRVVLLQGDGAAQMTFQEFSCYMSYDIKPIVFMFNNSGYTIEREIAGRYKSYNDTTADWDWTNMMKTFGDKDQTKHFSAKVNSFKELHDYQKKILQNSDYDNKVRFFECIFDKMDVTTTCSQFVNKETARA